MRVHLSYIVLGFLIAVGVPAVWGQPVDTTFNYWDMPLDSLSTLPRQEDPSELESTINDAVSVSTKKALSRRNSPNVITVITEEEIYNSGARDLIDVLRMVPGFTFGLDANGQIGLGIRGNWAHEGKVLLLMDGQEMNEIYTAKLFFGNRFPVQLIKRIEIIRGPGSAAYGGFAALGVINIITLSSDEYSGFHGGYIYGQMLGEEGARAARNRYFYIGKNWKNLTINYSTLTGNGQRSNRDHYGFYARELQAQLGAGNAVSLAGDADIDPNFHNFYVRWKGLSFRSLVDYYQVRDITLLDSLQRRPLQNGIRAAFSELKWEMKLSDKLTFTPQYIATWQYPSLTSRSDTFQVRQTQREISRNRLLLTANYKYSHRQSYLFGIDAYRDVLASKVSLQNLISSLGQSEYYNFAVFGQGILRLPTFNLIAGIRSEYNTQYGFAFSPRLALTRRFGDFHFKLLLDGAYRAPTIGNVAFSLDGGYSFNQDSSQLILQRGLDPERTISIEAEMGYKISEDIYVTANLYNMTIFNPIVLNAYQDENIRNVFGEQTTISVYQNFQRAGTRGLEVDFQFKKSWGHLNANYSLYSSGQQTLNSPYSVSSFAFDPDSRERVDTDMLLAFPHHRFNLSATYNLESKVSFTSTAHFYGSRYGYDVVPSAPGSQDVTGILVKEDPVLLWNVYVRHKDFLMKNLDAGLGVYNVMNADYRFYQPFFGLNPPAPDRSRTIQFHLAYRLDFGDRKKQDKNR